jgi:hypothetical protein
MADLKAPSTLTVVILNKLIVQRTINAAKDLQLLFVRLN